MAGILLVFTIIFQLSNKMYQIYNVFVVSTCIYHYGYLIRLVPKVEFPSVLLLEYTAQHVSSHREAL